MLLEQVQSLTDEQVVERVRQGETWLYELLMRRYNQRLYRITRSVLNDSAEAEDVMQDAWVRAYEHLDQFAGKAKFATWVTRIALYGALARARERRRSDGQELLDMGIFESKQRSPERQAIDSELRDLLESAVDELPEVYRSVFVLREIESLSTAETAECLELSEEAVKTRLHRSRAILRRILFERAGLATADSFRFLGTRCDRMVARVMERIHKL
ncbi:MAG TPA: RNA polymerase sigma factor [Bryobacteraceae bacterium]|nr:RNA polymerase sigma factor [Bryobacteraceae bacterium]